jgi:hypothetical protein
MSIRTTALMLTTLTLAALMLASPALAQPAGTWETDMGAMTLRVNGASVTGTYVLDNGKIIGTMRGSVLEGIWIEDGSNQRCAKPAPDGRYYWGRIRFTFDGSRFTGAFSYCDAPVRSADAWNGWRPGAAAPPPAADQEPLSITPRTTGQPHWRYLTTKVEPPTQDQLGPYCRLVTADARERGMRFEYGCKVPGGDPWQASGNFDFNIRMPTALVPGAKVYASGQITATGSPTASMSGSCWMGHENMGGAYLLDWISATGSGSTSTKGESVIPDPPPCAPDGTCAKMVVICTMASTQGLTATRYYTWTK